jgi:histidinol dehydrogenase
MRLIKYPRRQEWEKLFQIGETSTELGIYADETANPPDVSTVIFRAAQNGQRVVFTSSHSLIIEALLDEIDKGLINIAEKQATVRVLNLSNFVLMRNEDVSIDLLKAIQPKKVLMFCTNANLLAGRFKPSTFVANANNIDNI